MNSWQFSGVHQTTGETFKKRSLMKAPKLLGAILLWMGLLLSSITTWSQTPQTFTTSGTFTPPPGVTSIKVECWGGGGAGGGATGNTSAGGGGGGGSYVRNNAITVVPGTSYTVTVGTGGVGAATAGPAGGDSWFGTTSTILAKGGAGGALASSNNSTASGAAALTTGNVGSTSPYSYYGGGGGTGGASGASGGGGGGSAGTGGNGNPASGANAALAVTGGGAGVAGSTASADGANNTNLGGGGAGGRAGSNTDRLGGSGGDGQVIITYTCPTYSLTGVSAAGVCLPGASAITLTGSASGLPVGSYTVTYSLTGSNTATNATASMTVSTAGSGSFNTSSLTVAGSTTITISQIVSTSGSVNCTSTISANNTATITTTTKPAATISYAGTPFCKSLSTGQAVTRTGTTGGTYSSTAGLSIDASTGAINPSLSTAGTYTVTYTMAATGACVAQTATTNVTITAVPAASLSYSGSPFCKSITSGSPTLTGTTGGTYSSTAGLSINSSTGVINPSTSTAGTYTVTYTVAAAGGCSVYTTTSSVTINALPTASISGTATGCGSVTLTASGGTSYSWNGGSSSATAANSFTTSGTYIVTVTDANGCVSTASQAVTINALPGAVTATASANVICGSGSVNLTGSATGATSGTLAFQGFESTGSTVTYANTGGATKTGTSGTGDRPASTSFVNTGSTAFWVSNGTATVTTANITGLSAYSAKSVTIDLASFSIASTTNGADASDYVRVGISLDGGTTYSDELEVNGGTTANSYWSFTSGTGVASVTYDGTNTPTVFAPTGGGARTTDGYGQMVINLPDNASQVRIRITMVNNATSEGWIIDDITLAGTAMQYAWTSSPAGFTSSSQNPTGVSVSETTIYTLTATNSNGCTATDTAIVTVNPLPSAPSGVTNASRCGTGSVNLSAVAGADETIDWYTAASGGSIVAGGTGVTTLTTPSISTTTTYYAQVRNITTGCLASSRAGVTATINAVSSISNQTSSSTYGTATSYTITATGATGYSAASLPTGFSLNASTGILSLAANAVAGTHSISITVSNAGGCTATATLTYTRNAKALTATGVTTADKVYDGTVAATVTGGSLVGVVSPDVVTLNPSGNFATKTVGTNKAITSTSTLGGANAGNYTLTQPTLTARNITAKSLTVTGATGNNKVYDGTTTATLSGGSLVGVLSPDVVTLNQTGTFASKNVGNGITITSTCSLSGTDAGNYSLTQPTGLTANITQSALTVTANNLTKCFGNTYTFAGTAFTSSGLGSGDVITSVSFASDGADIFADLGTYAIVPSGATGASFSASNYSITYVNGTMTVVDVPTITQDPSTTSQTICQNAAATSFSIAATAGSGTISGYQWYNNSIANNFGGTPVAGATSSTITPSTAVGGTLYYYCVVTNSNGCTMTSNVSGAVVVNALPTAVTVSGGGTFCNNTLLNASNGSSGTIYYQGTTSGGTSTATPSTVQQVSQDGTYYFRAQSALGCWGAEGSAAVIFRAPIVSNVEICQGSLGSALTTSFSCPTTTGITAGDNDATAGTGTGWTTPGNIAGAGTASVSVAANATTNNLQGSGYGFAIPSYATITGITVTISRSSSSTSTTTNLRDNVVSLVKGGTVQATNRASATQWSNTTLANATYGGAADLWGSSWTPADINASNFGVVMSVTNLSTTTARTATVDFIRVTVTYTTTGTLSWYTASSGGSAIATGSSLNPVGVAGSGIINTNTPGTVSYYVECSLNPNCRGAGNFIINALPAAPSAGNASRCGTGTVAISATPGIGEIIDWYAAASGGSALSTGSNSFTTPSLSATTTYYAQARNLAKGCVSATRTAVTATINAIPAAPVAVNASRCGAGTVNLSVSAVSGITFDWYASASGGTALFTGSNSFTTPSLSATTTYYAEARNATTGCISASRTAVTATVKIPTSSTSSATACDTYSWNGNTYTASGTYTYTTTNSVGCDSVATLNLTIKRSSTSMTAIAACDSYSWNGTIYTASGTYTYTTTNSVSCDSVATLNLTITESTADSHSVSACDSYTWSENGVTYTQSGTYSVVTGCHTEVLNLTITASSSHSTTISACDSYTWSVNGQTYTQSGTYTDVNACHTEALVLTINASTGNTTTASVCDSYTWSVNGQTYTQSGTYTSVSGCHTETLQLTITASTTHTNAVTAADQYTWAENNTTYTASGTYTAVTGCHTEVLNLTIVASTNDTTVVAACDAYTWSQNGQTYTSTGIYSHVVGFTTHYLNLTITASTSHSATVSACDSYIWSVNGQTYTESGIYTDVDGCHTEILNLTITPSSSNSVSVSACDSYTWAANGETYTQSGTYTAVNGCNTATLHLTVTSSTTHSNSASACDSYTWSENGQTYTESGIYTAVTGCHTEVLNLTIISSSSNTTVVNACDSYIWSLNGQTYTASGTYTNVDGCHTEILQLTIVTTLNDELTITACDSYVWEMNGSTYTQSGTYNAVVGCHTQVLNLTINNSTHNVLTQVSCGSFAWNGNTYTASGTYVYEYNNASACASADTLHLTINPIPTVPGTVTGTSEVCSLIGSTTPSVYNTTGVNDAVSYQWTMPTGATLVSGQGTTSVTVTFSSALAATNQRIQVASVSDQGCLSATSSIVLSKTIPNIPAAIIGQTNVCPVMGLDSTLTYSVAAVTNADSYLWEVPVGGVIVSGQGTTSVQVKFTPAFTSGSMKVTAMAACGNRAARTLSLTKLLPSSPVAILGPTSACAYIGTNVQATYSIAPVANATSYLWTVPNNVTLVSGQGTTSIVVTFSGSYTTSTFKVRSVNNCFSTGDRQLSVTAATFSAPGTITGPTNACPYINSQDAVATYKIRKVANVSSYIWTVPAGVTIVSHPAGLGANDTVINVSFNSNFVYGSQILVQSAGCGASAARSLTINGVIPSSPGIISGPVNACEFMVSANNPNGNIASYTIRKVTGASQYIWAAPAGATIISHPAGTGENDTTINVKFEGSFSSGLVSVRSYNACGSSAQRTLSISRLNPATPSQFDVTQTSACPNRVYIYTLPSMPSNATSVLWTVPYGATIISGQGTTSISVAYPPTTVGGQVTAQSFNNCSSSSLRTLNIKLAACPSSFAGNATVTGKTSEAVAEPINASIAPNPTTSAFNLTLSGLHAAKEKVSVKVMDVQGRILKTFSMMPNDRLNFGNELKAGSYLVEVIQGNQVKTMRVMKF